MPHQDLNQGTGGFEKEKERGSIPVLLVSRRGFISRTMMMTMTMIAHERGNHYI
jgi:hypothetical protein